MYGRPGWDFARSNAVLARSEVKLKSVLDRGGMYYCSFLSSVIQHCLVVIHWLAFYRSVASQTMLHHLSQTPLIPENE